jgi:ketosteroid isomerase-like protein
MDGPALARAYYRTIDDGAYDELADLLAPTFVQERPDRTFSGRERFVRFMREERPDTETTHEVRSLYRSEDGVAVEGTLGRHGGSALFDFVDTFRFENGRITLLRTYTR